VERRRRDEEGCFLLSFGGGKDRKRDLLLALSPGVYGLRGMRLDDGAVRRMQHGCNSKRGLCDWLEGATMGKHGISGISLDEFL
jgi:hypothetical protein